MSRDTPSAPHFYAGQYLDRASDRRKDAAWLAQMLADPQTRYVPVWQHKSLISSGSDSAAVLLESRVGESAGEPGAASLRPERAARRPSRRLPVRWVHDLTAFAPGTAPNLSTSGAVLCITGSCACHSLPNRARHKGVRLPMLVRLSPPPQALAPRESEKRSLRLRPYPDSLAERAHPAAPAPLA